MDNRALIQNSLDYIEENLKTEITAQELAAHANFSLFHYYRLFLGAVGMPVMQYISRRKLLHAIYEISRGRKMVDAALEYGFDTYAGFYKAFQREFGYTPTAFLKKYPIVNKPYKINLDKEEHIMISHAKIRQILKEWNLQEEAISNVVYENTGIQSDNAFYIGSGYVLKLSANLGKLKNHIQISKCLENVGLSSATPVKTADGRKIVEDGDLYFCLTKRLEGVHLKTGDMYAGDVKSKARFIGEIIGQLSLALKNTDVVVNDVNIYETCRNWALPKAKACMELPEIACKKYMKAFGQLYDKLPKQIIHRDPNPGNILLSDGKWGFLDFELSEKNIRIFDPCYAATGILSESFDENDGKKLEKWIEIYRNIIYGYDSVAKLTAEEWKAVPYVILCNQLICVAWFSEQEKYRHIFETNKKMLTWLLSVFEKLTFS